MEKVLQIKKKFIMLQELMKLYKLETYQCLYDKINYLVASGYITPVKTSGLNGKNPALYKKYRIVMMQEDQDDYEEELTYQLNPLMDISYYMSHMKQYEKDREAILLLNAYFNQMPQEVQWISMNERSFEIWGREKYLKQEGGLTLLKRLGLSMEDLKVYETVTPVPYYTLHKATPQTVLIIENMDTFYSMRQHLMKGKTAIAGHLIGTLVYGCGKQIVKGFTSFIALGEPYLKEANQFLYFGDLDYEGIMIYESLKERAKGMATIQLCTSLYELMLQKSQSMSMPLPLMKEKQNQCEIQDFLNHFTQSDQKLIKAILEKGTYIPQEILNINDF